MEVFACSKCGFSFKNTEEYIKFVSYWGEEGWEDCECPKCNHKFQVKETVVRTWEICENPEEASDAGTKE